MAERESLSLRSLGDGVDDSGLPLTDSMLQVFVLFHMMRNRYISETKLVDTAVKEISSRLPPRWLLLNRGRGAAVRSPQESTRMIDAIWELREPDGLSSDIIVEVKANPGGAQAGRQCGVPAEGADHTQGTSRLAQPLPTCWSRPT